MGKGRARCSLSCIHRFSLAGVTRYKTSGTTGRVGHGGRTVPGPLQMDWSSFSIHLPEKDIPQLHTILDAVTPAELESKQVRPAHVQVLRVAATVLLLTWLVNFRFCSRLFA